ncbi:hypothetical protein PIB30_058131 [Stylosanthes scabra]|uniref:Uncharacterized protein n=1 Tax=Stylosanthes scabra TaxID=79078 RepID=A0ABU6TLI4_9FABA|nr:hypothetical protein [Stylosanthes scabra]
MSTKPPSFKVLNKPLQQEHLNLTPHETYPRCSLTPHPPSSHPSQPTLAPSRQRPPSTPILRRDLFTNVGAPSTAVHSSLIFDLHPPSPHPLSRQRPPSNPILRRALISH